MGEDITTPQAPAAKGRPVQLPKRYRIGEVIGEGGMGRVYRAHDTTLGRDVAIKVIEGELPGPDKTQQVERFVREARAAARILHPAIAIVHDVDPEAGWLVMELVDGQSLREVSSKGPLAPKLVRVIAAQVLAGLSAAHAGGVIHRDIKPSNIILGPDNRVKIVDFGVARLVDADMTRTGENLGTPAYMAPEQVRGGETDARTDLYGLGATLYELVTGVRLIAFESPNEATMQRLEAACKDATLAKLIARCLQADPDARFPSASAALEVLSTERRPSGHVPKQKTQYAIVLGGIALLFVGAAVAWWQMRDPDRPTDSRPAQAFTLAQRGEHERAGDLLEGYLAEHPDDGDAIATKLLCDWWQHGVIDKITQRAIDAKLRPTSRAMIHGIDLIAQRRENEAVAYLERASREHPNSPEILYALGEAQWHGQHYDEGSRALERAFTIDPRWLMALHHVVEFRATRGEAAQLVPLAERMRPLDPPAAAALDCRIAIGERRYADAVKLAMSPTPIAENYICLAQAQILAGDLDAAMTTAKRAMELSPIDLREFGGFSLYAELYLYRGRFREYLDLLRNKPSRQNTLARILWNKDPQVNHTAPDGKGMRLPPLGAATWLLWQQLRQVDPVETYREYPEIEIRHYGFGIWAEARGDLDAAVDHYRKGLAAPSKGDLRLLFGHHLARILYTRGDPAGAAAACQEVIAPRAYQVYRALLLPDCLLWSGQEKRLVETWQGELDHPAVVEARRRLAAHP
jgi:tetratricopeptide (TPR) repeat protein/predicted Ser/Thr protein kinase